MKANIWLIGGVTLLALLALGVAAHRWTQTPGAAQAGLDAQAPGWMGMMGLDAMESGGMMAMHQQMHGAGGMGMGGMGHMGGMHQGMGAMHAQMDEIFEGTYADLVEKRKDTGVNLAPMIQSAEDFEVMKAHHALMEKRHKENEENGGMGCMAMTGEQDLQQNP